MNIRLFSTPLWTIILCGAAMSSTYYVSPSGSNTNAGALNQPFQTIQKAADIMQPGDTCYVRTGTYREYINPLRGGTSETTRIVYKAYPGEKPVIKGSEQITGWTLVSGTVYKKDIADSFFGAFNPYTTNVGGDWFNFGGATHLGDVYLNGVCFKEKHSTADLTAVQNTWYTEHSGTTTTIFANFGQTNPNNETVEINTRETVFFPSATGIQYLTVDGFTMQHASTNWAPPESFQKGLIGTNWGKSWIIQNCRISDSKCVGICSGNSSGGASFNINSIGNHIVRNNIIERCGEAGIAGSRGFCASLIENNLIEDINYKSDFGGEETAGIKVHYAVDIVIKNNIIRRVFNSHGNGPGSFPGMWIDWQNQGARITGNIIYNTDEKCLYLEACHGPMLVDNNIFIGKPIQIHSKRIVLTHNLFYNSGVTFQDWQADTRRPGYYTPHTVQSAGSGQIQNEGNRFYNNIFIRSNVATAPQAIDCKSDFNLLYKSIVNTLADTNSVKDTSYEPTLFLGDFASGVQIELGLNNSLSAVSCPLITRSFIGVFSTVNQGIENHDGSAITINTDIRNTARSSQHPTVGPFELLPAQLTRYTLIAGPDYAQNGPVCSIASPARDSMLIPVPSSVPVQAMASQIGNGSVAKVEFFRDDIKIGEDINGTDGWSVNWQSPQNGVYALTCKATDNNGISTTSLPSRIYIGGRQPDNVTNLAKGIAFKYYEFDSVTVWPGLPPFADLTPVKDSICSTIATSFVKKPSYSGCVYTGYFYAITDGKYTFTTTTTGDIRITIGASVVVDNVSINKTTSSASGAIGLAAGKHQIKIEFYQRSDPNTFTFGFKKPNSQSITLGFVMPDSLLWHATANSPIKNPIKKTDIRRNDPSKLQVFTIQGALVGEYAIFNQQDIARIPGLSQGLYVYKIVSGNAVKVLVQPSFRKHRSALKIVTTEK